MQTFLEVKGKIFPTSGILKQLDIEDKDLEVELCRRAALGVIGENASPDFNCPAIKLDSLSNDNVVPTDISATEQAREDSFVKIEKAARLA